MKVQNVNVHIGGKLETQRYCHGCGKDVTFLDSGLKRRNANGKNIYEFAIYKCEKGHTWNKKLSGYKSYERVINDEEEINVNNEFSPIVVKSIRDIERLDIRISGIVNDLRIDKFLGKYLLDLSRTTIQKYIEADFILVNQKQIKISYKLKDDDTISIFIKKISLPNNV